MKRLSLLIAMIALVCGNAFAQFSYDFSDGTVGAKIAATYGLPWTTWGGTPGSGQDGVFAELNGDMTAFFDQGNDQVLSFDERTSGVYNIEFDVYIEENYGAYFNVMHHYPCNHDQAIQVYMQVVSTGSQGEVPYVSDGHGSVHAAGSQAFDLPCRWNDWMHIRIRVDIDNDVAEFYFDETFMYTWQWSADSFGQKYSDITLGGIDFYPLENIDNSRYYIDNVSFTEEGADEVFIDESFEEYTVGNKVALEATAAGHSWWTTWSQAPGESNDGTVSDAFASDGVKSAYITDATDQVLLLGNKSEGVYELSFDMYTEAGYDGYFNILHRFPVGPSSNNSGDWAIQVFVNAESDPTVEDGEVHSPGHGTVHAGGASVADLPCVEDEWMHFRVYIDCDNDLANLYFNEELMYTWQWSVGSFGDESTSVIAAANFFGPMETSHFYVDNIRFVKPGEVFAPVFSVDAEEVEVSLELDDMDQVSFTIENSGNGMGDWSGWIDFGEAPEGESDILELAYHNGDVDHVGGIGSSVECTREIAMRLPATAYGPSAMGMKITSARFYISGDGQAADYNYTLRVRGQNVKGGPGEILTEKTINTDDDEVWIEAVFDEPVVMRGQELWVTVFLNQHAGDYPLSMDNDDYGEESDGNWISTDGGKFKHCYYGDSGITGAWFIEATCEGTPMPGAWVFADKYGGYIQDGTSEIVTLFFNTNFLEPGTYNAVYRLSTNDPGLAEKEIPITLNAIYDAVDETVADAYEIYPNPATTSVTLKGENLNCVAIYNVAGQLVRVVKLNDVVNTIDMDVEAGVYFFSIYDNDGANTVQRVVIAK